MGFALAREFLKAGDSVVVCGRNVERVKGAVAALQKEFGAARVQVRHCTPTGHTLES